MTEKEIKVEMELCKDCRYFHNKYCTYPNKRQISKKEWDKIIKVAHCYPLKKTQIKNRKP